MLKLIPRSADPVTLDVMPGVRVTARPVTIPMILGARNVSAAAFSEGDEPEPTRAVRAEIAFVKSLGRQGFTEWEGVGDEAGEPIDVSPEAVDRLLDIVPIYDAVRRDYVGPALYPEGLTDGG